MRKSLLLGTLLVITASAQAEITKCNGMWTNRPCDAHPSTVIKEKAYVPPSATEVERRQKNAIFQEYDVQRLSAEAKYKISLNSASAHAACDTGTMAECRASVAEAEKQLHETVVQLHTAKPEEKKAESATHKQESGPSSVTIVTNSEQNIIVKPRHGERPHTSEHLREPPPPPPPAPIPPEPTKLADKPASHGSILAPEPPATRKHR